MQVKYKTLLEKMSKGEKYEFVKAHNHPFADVAGIPYFNPYGKVPLDNKLTAIIPKATGSLFISSGQRLDFPEYLEGRVSCSFYYIYSSLLVPIGSDTSSNCLQYPRQRHY
jgi:hypothetical protein